VTALPFLHVDAFADGPFSGNPAAVILLDRWRHDALLQAVAAEINLPATAFAVPAASGADYEMRWFSPRAEIGLCGHGTLAAGHALIGERDAVRFATRKAGVVAVTRSGDGYSLSLPALVAEPRALRESAAAMGGVPVETLWHERGYAILRYAGEDVIRALTPDSAALQALGDIQHIATAPGDTTDIVSRVFSGRGMEDAVTGSAHALLTPYWAEMLGCPAFTAFQASARGGRLSCRLDGDRAVLGGRCVTVIEGSFSI
jgi:predicted PhzF superfamily epimerase YddE/YHI9